MVAKELALLGGIAILGFVFTSAISGRIPDPAESIGKALTAENDSVTGETPEEKGALRNTEDFLYGDGSSAARIARDEANTMRREAKGAIGNTADFLFGENYFEGFVNRQGAALRNFFGLPPFMPNNEVAQPLDAPREERLISVTTSKNGRGRSRFGQ